MTTSATFSAPSAPSAIRALSDRVHDEIVLATPAVRAQLGLPIEHLPLDAESSWARDAAFARGILTELSRAPAVDDDDRNTAGFMQHALGSIVSREQHRNAGFTVTPYQSHDFTHCLGYAFSGFSGSPTAYTTLAADYRDGVQGMQRRLERQRALGILVPRPALPGVRRSLAAARAASDETIRASAPGPVGEAAVFDEITAAYDALLASLGTDYEDAASDSVCLSEQPGGEAHYRALVREYTCSDRTPEELHEQGLAQVAELTENMTELRDHMGFSGSEADFHRSLRTDPRVHARHDGEVDALFRRHMAALEPRIGDFFSTLPEAPYDVARLDPAMEAGMTFGFYEPPTAARPVGRYRWNGADLENKSLLTYAAVIFHELAPGHHFHLARQAENHDLPELRRWWPLTAFTEGWAEYASGLGWEMGLYDDPLDAYGRRVHERFVAQRLVIDTGLNLFGWSVEKATAYMQAHTTESPAQIASEVLRYATDLPGQALSYRAGHLELLRLRRRAEDALGARFDLRAFHEHVLAPGSLPFPVIEESLDRLIARG